MRFKNATGVDTSNFAKKVDLANLKFNIDKSYIYIYKFKNVPTNLSNLKSKVDKLDLNNLVRVPVDLSKLSHVVKNDVVKKDVYNAKIKNIENKTADITSLTTNASLKAKINEVKSEIPSITNLATTSALTAVENKMSNVNDFVKKTGYSTKSSEIENKITIDHDHDKYLTSQELLRNIKK